MTEMRRLNIHGDAYRITAALWLAVPLLGAIPYIATGTVPTLTDAFFESVSGFTTTGSSVVAAPEALPVWLRLWRALTQWIGGLGLVLFIIALAPSLRAESQQLYAAEFSGTQQRKLHPHTATSVGRMWHIYTLLTIILAAALMLSGVEATDAVCLAMSTVSTGGFMTATGGLAGYSTLTMSILTLFMFLSGVNVALLYNFFTLSWRRLRRNQEFAVYVAVFALASAGCTVAFVAAGNPWGESVRYSLFHVAATVSTCGFYTTAPQHWPFVVSALSFPLILCGAMAGSTGGGLKLRRVMTLVRYLRNYFTRMIHPNAVFTVKIDRQVVSADYVNKIFGFVFLYILFIVGGAFVLTLCGSGIADAFCLAAANMSNLGPSPLINSLGADFNYAVLPAAAKWTLMLLMIAGRVEIFALLAIVSPSYWRTR